MINKNDIREGDTVRLRSAGSHIVTQEEVCLAIGGIGIGNWYENGKYCVGKETAFDIVEIIPKPKPKVLEAWFDVYSCGEFGKNHKTIDSCQIAGYGIETIGIYKITITDGEPKIEKVEL